MTCGHRRQLEIDSVKLDGLPVERKVYRFLALLRVCRIGLIDVTGMQRTTQPTMDTGILASTKMK